MYNALSQQYLFFLYLSSKIWNWQFDSDRLKRNIPFEIINQNE